MNNEPGIYRIVNTVTNRTYIGSSINVHARLRGHKRMLKNGTHRNPHLQYSWNKHGEQSFEFELLVNCDRTNIELREQQFMDAYFEHDMLLYNVKPSSDSHMGFRYQHTPEAKAKISHKASNRSPEFLEKQRLSHLGKKNSPETRAKIIKANTGRRASDETKAKMRKIHLKRYESQDERDKISRQMIGNKHAKGQKHTAERLEAIRQSMLGNQHHLGHIHSDEARGKMRLAWIRRKVRKELLS